MQYFLESGPLSNKFLSFFMNYIVQRKLNELCIKESSSSETFYSYSSERNNWTESG